MAITLPDSTSVQQIQTRRDPGVNVPGAAPSGLQELGSAISQVAQKFQDANDARVLSNLEAETAREYTNFTKRLEEDPDSFDKWEQQFDEFSRDHREAMKKSGANRNVMDAWERSIAPIELRTRLKVTSKARETMVDKGITELDRNLLDIQDLAITGTKEDRQLYISQADLMIERAQNTGLIRDSDAEERRQKFRSGTEKARFKNAVRLNPKLAKEALDAGDFEVSETEKPEWESHVEAAIKADNAEQHRIKEEQREQSYYDAVRGINEAIDAGETKFDIKSEFMPLFDEDSKGAEKLRVYIESRFKEEEQVDWNMYIAGQEEIDRRAELGQPMTNEEIQLEYGPGTGKMLRNLLSRNTTARNRVRSQSYQTATKKLKKYLETDKLGERASNEAQQKYVELGLELEQFMDQNKDGNPSEWVDKRIQNYEKERLLEDLDGWSWFKKTPIERFTDMSDDDIAKTLIVSNGGKATPELIEKVKFADDFDDKKLAIMRRLAQDIGKLEEFNNQ